MTTERARAISEDRMAREAAAHLRGEDVAEDAALIGAAGYAAHYVDEHQSVDAALGGYSASPTDEDKRPAFERTSYVPRAVPFNQILELWAAHEGGTLASVLPVRPGDDGKPGEDEARLAWEWVRETPGWNAVVHEVMKHLILRRKTWEQWPVAPPVKSQRMTFGDRTGATWVEVWQYCDWPFVTYEAAGAAWMPFYRALRKHYRREPFTVNEQFFETR